MILDKKIQYIYNQLAFVCQDLLHNSPSANKTREYINSRLSKAIQKKYALEEIFSKDVAG